MFGHGNISSNMTTDGFAIDEIFCDKNGVHEFVKDLRNVIMRKKGLNLSSTTDKKQVTLSDYKEFIASINGYEDDILLKWKEDFKKLSHTCYDAFQFYANGMPWNPNTSVPANGIGTAYIAAVAFHNTIYKHSKMQSITTKTKPSECSMPSTYKNTFIPDSIKEDNTNVEYRVQGGMFAHAQITGLSPSSTPKSRKKRSNPSKNVLTKTVKQNKMVSKQSI